MRTPASALRMSKGDEPQDMSRRDLFKAAAFLAAPLAAGLAATPASAQLPNFLGDSRGERPGGLGPVAGGRFLSLCDSENCVSTSEDVYSKRYLPPWTYNDEGQKKKTTAEAMEELAAVIKDYKGAKIIKQEPNYLYAEFERDFAFVDDVEFLFSPNGQTVEYRSAARKSKKSDHRSRIKAIRVELQKKGWRSVGYR